MKRKTLRPPDVRLIKALYAIGLGPIVGRLLVLITTTGRKSGLPRTTALQYEEVDGALYLGSSKGTHADWFRNLMVDPCVAVRVKSRQFTGRAELVTDPVRIADFIELRLRRHPRMVGVILKSDGLSATPSRAELETYASKLAMAIIKPM
ncbi:MAG: nitroreductase family deazaflavin-dependent oxidoreductase [Chloroflexi bacterium]|nr:nitroreductase family deazaflavin-dependent oxidoreductase [Chloroflexota bacterium]